ncbi:lysylphosphatidylglycerol synthase domain-containing protein [Pseudonocardia sp. KRD291]|uniref:lysylphosphatidylglycerol synthase domain-containing protein n=1 Tax=Pseudonocardia sp. KRD291 TaxID=2792007 RepID=UPI001C4A4581|nr:lysylphosphatidylglycerol synthase domain-containing protein [Pseudonocardia sp. KRD291]MBW0105267.1 flippase-like domain-containing protein [Pseudonocardia sp. KRD291]
MRPLHRVATAASTVLRSPWLRAAFLFAAIALAAVALIDQRVAVLAAVARVSGAGLGLAGMATIVNLVLAAVAWHSVVTDLGARLGRAPAARVYLVGQVGKYLPGGVWNLLAAAELGRDHGIARRETVSSMLLAVAVSGSTAAALAAATLLELPLVLLAPLPLMVLHPKVLNLMIAVVLSLAKRDPLSGHLSIRGSAVAASWTMLSWLAIGVQVFVLAVSVGAPPTARTMALALGAYVLAWLVGTAAVVLPAGAGAREATLVVVLAPAVGVGAAVVVALLSRVLVTAADLGLAGVGLLAARAARNGARPVQTDHG